MNGETHRWLVALRWVVVLGQLALLGGAYARDAGALPWAPLLGVVALTAASNAVLAAALRRGRGESLVGPTLLLDTLALTALLALSGGPANPFAVLYLVHVTLAAVSVNLRWTWALVITALLGYGALFAWHLPLPPELGGQGMHGGHGAHDASSGFDVHLQGMWVAFALAATSIAFFVARVRRELEAERERASRAARLAATTTLAAGAAHELATPLATIKVAAGELVRALESRPELEQLLDDARLVRREVERSRAVLDRLSLDAGATRGEARETIAAGALIDAVLEAIDTRASRVRVRADRALALSIPPAALTNAIASLVRNALDASESAREVDLAIEARGDRALSISVVDRGAGMSPEVLARAGEPFFTTKAPGAGMGLGVFLVRTLAEQLGGALHLRSEPGRGTTAELEIPQGIA